ncbi:hypothetical protein [Erythrobacter sp. YT30]|uniref:DUF4345 family protein n=1 Tax=Erythrobacter sp. YT30 TaxID=1735012 RepID=UPI00076D3032|nr:hypothetical protein [Erythrobacter sp. YT30]KWV91808.1 hypothetical protein AUC45_11450 [Erythrobacter sp. YT30]
MIIALRFLLILGGGVLLFMAAGFLSDPVGSGADFGLVIEGAHATTSARADFTAFFGVSGICYLWGALARRADPLIIGAALMLVALAARLLSLFIDGSFEGFIAPIVFETVFGVLALIGAAALPGTKKRRGGIQSAL